MRTIFIGEIEGSCNPRTVSAQFLAETEGRKMRFQKIIKFHRSQATIYGRSEKHHYYRLAYYTAGKRQILNFRTYSEAKTEQSGLSAILPTQGSSCLATLGFGPESRWDSRWDALLCWRHDGN